jgi:hypothetical protein
MHTRLRTAGRSEEVLPGHIDKRGGSWRLPLEIYETTKEPRTRFAFALHAREMDSKRVVKHTSVCVSGVVSVFHADSVVDIGCKQGKKQINKQWGIDSPTAD